MSTLFDLQQATGGTLDRSAGGAGDPAAVTLGPLCTDSRQVEPGCVFWGLKGPHYDGDDFAEDALAAGAQGAVVAKPVEPRAGWVLRVADTQRALTDWAAWKRRHFSGMVIGVTGSVGKTTTRQMIHAVLGSRLSGTASARNYNNHWGVPLTLARLEPAFDYAVVEMGASRRGEIAALAALSAPKIGVITQASDAHLGMFGSRQSVASAKAELLAALPPDGHAVLGDDPWLRRMAGACRAPITWVGRRAECDLAAADVHCGQGNLRFSLDGCEFSVPVWGRHHLVSALLAVGVGRVMGLDLDRIAAALRGFCPLPMRCQVTEVRGATLINDAYNASPAAMRAALELLRDFDGPGRRIVVSGDMGDLGDQAQWLHHQLGNQIVTVCGADLLIACGQYARDVVAGARAAGMPRPHTIPCRTPEEALPYLGQVVLPGDVLLVKGARAMAMERIVEALTEYPRRRTA
jgi:UDP-N-acetylmuramoyl-tripeptide--D-alanyl-D-alanine ligase